MLVDESPKDDKLKDDRWQKFMKVTYARLTFFFSS